MEVELDPSAVGQSFEKVGQIISEAQLENLQTVGPLDQNREHAPEEWLRNDSTEPSAGALRASLLVALKVYFLSWETSSQSLLITRSIERGCHSRTGAAPRVHSADMLYS